MSPSLAFMDYLIGFGWLHSSVAGSMLGDLSRILASPECWVLLQLGSAFLSHPSWFLFLVIVLQIFPWPLQFRTSNANWGSVLTNGFACLSQCQDPFMPSKSVPPGWLSHCQVRLLAHSTNLPAPGTQLLCVDFEKHFPKDLTVMMLVSS